MKAPCPQTHNHSESVQNFVNFKLERFCFRKVVLFFYKNIGPFLGEENNCNKQFSQRGKSVLFDLDLEEYPLMNSRN